MSALVLFACAASQPFCTELGEGRWRLSEELSFVFRRGRAYFLSSDGRASELGRTRAERVRLYSLGWGVFAESEGELLCLNYGGVASAPASLRTRRLERPVFRDDFLRDPEAPSDWKPLRGEWRIERYRDALVARDGGPYATGWLKGTGEPAVTLTGRRAWCAFCAAVSARIVRGSCGLVFGAAEERYFAFEVSEGQARLLSFPGGKVLAREPCRAESWTRLVLKRGVENVACFVDGREMFRVPLREGVAGKAGLFARGEALFDDFEVTPLRSFSFDSRRAEPGRIREEGAGWAFEGPEWSRGAELGLSSEEPFSVYLGGAGPSTLRSSSPTATEDGSPAEPTPPKRLRRLEAGASARKGGAGLGFDRGAATLRTGGSRETCDVRPPLTFRVDGRRAEVWKNEERLLACPVDASGGLRPFFSSSGPLRICAASPGRPGNARASFDFSRARIRGEAHDDRYSYKVVGHLLTPRGRWNVRDGRLACEEKGELRCREPLWGEPEVRVKLLQGAGGAFIASRGRGGDGYRVVIDSGRMRLYRLGEELACATAGAGEGTLSLSRVGRWVRASFGEKVLAWRDEDPLTGGWAGLFGEADAEFDDLELADPSSRFYRFDRVETDWKEACGDWRLHAGIACIAWGRWITGGRARGWKGLALMRSKLSLPRDVELRLSVSESTDGMPDGDHVHYPYHDVILGLRAGSASVEDGYVFWVARSGKGIELLRRGEVVCRYDGLAIRMGSHNNSPRELGLAARARGKEIVLELNGREVIRFRDPDPLSGRVAFFGVRDCRANFSDVAVTPLRPWQETLPPPP